MRDFIKIFMVNLIGIIYGIILKLGELQEIWQIILLSYMQLIQVGLLSLSYSIESNNPSVTDGDKKAYISVSVEGIVSGIYINFHLLELVYF